MGCVLGLATACIPDRGYTIHVTNPCNHQVAVRFVDYPEGTDPRLREGSTVREVDAFGSTRFGGIPFDDMVAEVSAPALGWYDEWVDPKRGESRELTIDPALCLR